MLLVKLIEAVVRIVGGAGFDRSRHVVDSGLLGALGLAGWCGLRARSKKRRRKSKRTTNRMSTQGMPPIKSADMASYASPHSVATLGGPPPGFVGPDGRKGSPHSGPPPSVLRPEHALPRPYREDDDDEGYIMGAWQSYPLRHGYVPVAEPAATPPPPKSGFARVGGGRSHIDTPYAIMDGTASAFANNGSTQAIASSSMHALGNSSTHTFPSLKQQNQSRTTLPRPGSMSAAAGTNVFYDDDDPPPSLSSLSNVARQPEYGQLPPGAMQPAHVRTKSQTAIIEDASKLYGLPVLTGVATSAGNAPGGNGGSGPPSSTPGGGTAVTWPHTTTAQQAQFSGSADDNDDDDDDDDDDSTVEEQPKKKPWYRIIRHRPNSSDGPSSAAAPPSSFPVDAELGGLAASSSIASGSNGGSSNDTSGSSSTQQPTRSFVVIRKPQPQSMSRLTPSQSSSQLQNATYPPPGSSTKP